MSTKSSIKYCNTKNLRLHLYNCFVNGNQLAISVGNMKKDLIIDLSNEEAEQIQKQLSE